MRSLLMFILISLLSACADDEPSGIFPDCGSTQEVVPNPYADFLAQPKATMAVYENEQGDLDTINVVSLKKGHTQVPRACAIAETIVGAYETNWEDDIRIVFNSSFPVLPPYLIVEIGPFDFPIMYPDYNFGAASFLERLDSFSFRNKLYHDVVLANCLDSTACYGISQVGFVAGKGLAFYSNIDGDWVLLE